MTKAQALSRIPKRELPAFWVGSQDKLKLALRLVKKGKKNRIAQSTSGRPVYAISYGQPDRKPLANYNSAVASHCRAAYFAKSKRTKPVVMFLGPVHGAEVEGLTGVCNLIALMETGEDLAGKKRPDLVSLARKCRPVIVPSGNPDGLARFAPQSLLGMAPEDLRFWGQGTWRDNTFCGYPQCKSLHPMQPGKTAFLGCYFNDKGINPMHDELFAPMSPEVPALLKLAARWGPDLIVSLHSHENAPMVLRPSFQAPSSLDAIHQFATAYHQALETKGLPFNPVFNKDPGPNVPGIFSLVSGLHHTSGSPAFTFECPHGLIGRHACQVSFEEILEIEMCLFKTMFESVLR